MGAGAAALGALALRTAACRMALPVKRPLALGVDDEQQEYEETSSLLGSTADGRAAAAGESSGWSRSHWRIILAGYFGYMSKTFGEAAFDLVRTQAIHRCF